MPTDGGELVKGQRDRESGTVGRRLQSTSLCSLHSEKRSWEVFAKIHCHTLAKSEGEEGISSFYIGTRTRRLEKGYTKSWSNLSPSALGMDMQHWSAISALFVSSSEIPMLDQVDCWWALGSRVKLVFGGTWHCQIED